MSVRNSCALAPYTWSRRPARIGHDQQSRKINKAASAANNATALDETF
jgi:hypothetical protein